MAWELMIQDSGRGRSIGLSRPAITLWKLHHLPSDSSGTMCTVNCALHTEYWTMCTAHCTLQIKHYTLDTEYPTLHTAHCKLHTTQCKLHTLNCSLHTLDTQCTLRTAYCILHNWCIIHFTLHTHCTLQKCSYSTMSSPLRYAIALSQRGAWVAGVNRGQCFTVQCCTLLTTVQCSILLYCPAYFVLCSAVQFSTVLYCTDHCTVLSSAVLHWSLYSAVQCCIALITLQCCITDWSEGSGSSAVAEGVKRAGRESGRESTYFPPTTSVLNRQGSYIHLTDTCIYQGRIKHQIAAPWDIFGEY